MADLLNGRSVVSVLLEKVRKRLCGLRRKFLLLLAERTVAVLEIGSGTQSGQQSVPGGTTRGDLDVVPREGDTGGGQAIDIWRLHPGLTITAQLWPQIIDRDEQDVGLPGLKFRATDGPTGNAPRNDCQQPRALAGRPARCYAFLHRIPLC